MNKRKVVLSKRAAKTLEGLLDYLKLEWSENVKNEFIVKMDNATEQICNFPYSAKKSLKSENVFRKVVTKQTTIIYRVSKKEIEIIVIWDNRMNPLQTNY